MLDQLKEKTKLAADKAQKGLDKASDKLKLKESARSAASAAHKGVDKVEATFHIDIPEGALSSDDEDEEDGLIGGVSDEFAKLSFKQRMLGAVACYLVSGAIAFLASVLLVTGVHRHVRWYTFFYLLSSLITFASLLFILGQKRLEKRMLNAKRQQSGHIWIGSFALSALLALFFPGLWFFILLLLIVQFGTMVWYGSSFLPYARKLIKKYAAERVIHGDDDK
jgi:hypothetical protein